MTRPLCAAVCAWAAAVVLSSCGGGGSGGCPALDFNCIGNPAAAPTVVSLAPASVVAGSTGFVLTATGANFDASSVVNLSGNSASQALPTVFVNATTVTATVPASAIVATGNYQVTVTNSSSLTSAALAFPVVSELDFALLATPDLVVLRDGSATPVPVAIRSLTTFAGTVDLTIAGLPEGVTASFAPASIAIAAGTTLTTTLTLTASSTAATTSPSTLLQIVGSAAGLVRSAQLQIEIFGALNSDIGIVDVISRIDPHHIEDLDVYANGLSDDVSLSEDGRYAAFSASATNLIDPPTRNGNEVFVHDPFPERECGFTLCSGTTWLASAAATSSVEGNNVSKGPTAISADGRFIAFESDATDLVAGVVANFTQQYVRDTCTGAPAGCVPTTTMVSLTSAGGEPNGVSKGIAMSRDGRYLAFVSLGMNLVATIPVSGQVYLRDTCRTTTVRAVPGCTPVTVLVSADARGNPGESGWPADRWLSVSANGRFVAFSSQASNFRGGSPQHTPQDYIRDTCINTAGCEPSLAIVSVDDAGNPAAAGDATRHPAMSADGRFVAFTSASALTSGSSSPFSNVFVRDTCRSESGLVAGCAPSTVAVSLAADGSAANGDSNITPRSISTNGRYVAFVSLATNLVAGVGRQFGLYVRDTCAGPVAGCVPLTRLISVENGAFVPARFDSASISGDGAFAAYVVYANSGPKSDQAALVRTGF